MDCKADKTRFIQTVAHLSRNDIKSVPTRSEEYLKPEDISELEHNIVFVPMSLILFLRHIFSENNADLKSALLGQAIMQAARPRVLLAPLQIGFAVQMHHYFGPVAHLFP